MSHKQEQKEPWEALPDVWKTKSAYFSWLRGILRKGWNRHPAKIKLLNERRYKIKNPNPRGNRAEVWGLKCDCCGREAPMKQFEVDHVNAAGSLREWNDVGRFTQMLLGCSKDDLRILCIDPCHRAVSYAERMGISFEEALIEKQVIVLKKLNMTELKSKMTEDGITYDSSLKKSELLNLVRNHLMKQSEKDDNDNYSNQ